MGVDAFSATWDQRFFLALFFLTHRWVKPSHVAYFFILQSKRQKVISISFCSLISSTASQKKNSKRNKGKDLFCDLAGMKKGFKINNLKAVY